MKKLLLIITTTLLIQLNTIYSQQLKPVIKIKIQFGKAEKQIGIDKGGGEHWKPLFFHVDKKGNIHIPDFYKQRIVIYNKKGEYIKKIACKEGISPRMNYFSLAPNDQYVTYSDYTLYLLSTEGKTIWKRQFGFGIIPRYIYTNKNGIFIILPGKDERSIIFNYSSNQPLGRFGFMNNDKGIPMIMFGDKGRFALNFHNMKKIPGLELTDKAFTLEEDVNLVYVDDNLNSIWKKKDGNIEYFYLFSDIGKLIEKATIHFPDTNINGTGFWTVCDNDMNIYKNYFYEDYMEIAVYKIKQEKEPQ